MQDVSDLGSCCGSRFSIYCALIQFCWPQIVNVLIVAMLYSFCFWFVFGLLSPVSLRMFFYMRHQSSASCENVWFVYWVAIRLVALSWFTQWKQECSSCYCLYLKWCFYDSVRYELPRSCVTVWEGFEWETDNSWHMIRKLYLNLTKTQWMCLIEDIRMNK